MNTHESHHLSSELLQAMAEGELDAARMEAAQAHLAGCGRCRGELEGWQLLFSELEELPDLGPTPGFAERVLAEVEVRPPLSQRMGDRIRALVPGRKVGAGVRHLSTDGIHDYLDRRLAARVRIRVDAHLAECPGCRDEVEAWAPVFQGLGALPRLSPAPGFADAVMTRVPVAAIARAYQTPEESWTSRLAGVASRAVPRSRKGWAVAGGLVAAPAAAMVAGVVAVLVHPLLSFGGLLTFARWQMAGAVGAGWSRALEFLGSSPVMLQAWEVVGALLQAPAAAAFGLAALWASVLASAWVLYRHVIAPSFSRESHAKASS